jgi:hypothetical protein
MGQLIINPWGDSIMGSIVTIDDRDVVMVSFHILLFKTLWILSTCSTARNCYNDNVLHNTKLESLEFVLNCDAIGV